MTVYTLLMETVHYLGQNTKHNKIIYTILFQTYLQDTHSEMEYQSWKKAQNIHTRTF